MRKISKQLCTGQYQEFKYTWNLNTEIQESARGKGREITELMAKIFKFVENKNCKDPICSTNPKQAHHNQIAENQR